MWKIVKIAVEIIDFIKKLSKFFFSIGPYTKYNEAKACNPRL